jgi:hypothetical protein
MATLITQKIDAHCLGEVYRTRQQQEIYDVSGGRVGESSIAPSIYIQDCISSLRESSLLSLSERLKRLNKAGKIYAEMTLAGLDPDGYAALVSSVTGLQQSVIEKSIANIAHSLCHMKDILEVSTPRGAVWDKNDKQVQDGCSYFSRRGDILAIIAAGNGPGMHGLWPQAIAMGYKTLVRPSLREPFTAQRLICALEVAGLANYVAFMPTDYKGAEILIDQSDLAVVYGGPDIVDKYKNNSRVLVQGPGRSKIVVGSDVSQKEAVSVAAQSVFSLGGAACVSTSAILVEGDAHHFAKELQRELNFLSKKNPARFGGQQEAKAYEQLLQSDEPSWSYDSTDNQACLLNPHVTVVESHADPKVQRELPFPCVTVAPFDRKDACYKTLSGSLVVTVLSRQQEVINPILDDPTIANVYIGKIPTTWMDCLVPHSGYLSDFLMCNRGLRIESNWM